MTDKKSKTITIPAVVRQLADTIKPDIQMDANGHGKLPAGYWEKVLPEGVTPQVVSAIDSAMTTFKAAQGLAISELGLEAFKADKDLKSVSISTDFGSGLNRRVIEQTVLREKQVRNVQTSEVSTSYCALASKVVQKGNGGLSQVKDLVKTMGREALG